VNIGGIEVSPGQIVIAVVPSILFLVVLGVSGWILFRLSRQRQSRGLYLMSLGFLIKTVVDGIWEIFYWSLGGPFYVFTLIHQGMSIAQASAASAIITWTGEGVTFATLAIMVALIIYGATLITQIVPPRTLDAPIGP